jgi:NTP pyrophosphatase (non-canonical NTP hydrolase)
MGTEMNILWDFHTAIVDKSIVPGTDEDKRFLALALCGEVGELANVIKKIWRGDKFDPAKLEAMLEEEMGDCYAYLQLLACAFGKDLNEIQERVIMPKIRARWGDRLSGQPVQLDQREKDVVRVVNPDDPKQYVDIHRIRTERLSGPPTHYVHCNAGNALFVKEATFFAEQGGLEEEWGKHWHPVVATSIGDARRQAARLYNVRLSRIHAGEE